ncbi:unnamed protein product [Lactuca virosa]|uniref:Uncharacterized protein n=1 Tax=Lactuca virosa TaxID=75947 RepID=A0AAU9PPU8_9ASTR|nr:unnamed protein product [Lactuca virosa]
MDSNLLNKYHQFQLQNTDEQFELLKVSCNYTATVYLFHWRKLVYKLDNQNLYSKPMPWIGMYIAFASLLCIFAMMADLLHGLRNRKLWFPCKYFTLNAASLTVIAVAIKLPMDLTNLMPASVDITAKFGSMCFMCTMMANLLPSLATMNSKELVANIIALVVLVITLVGNVCIQIHTGILDYYEDDYVFPETSGYAYVNFHPSGSSALISVVTLLMMLIIYVCSSLAILKSKQILETKYQASHQTTLMDQELQQPGRLLTVEKLKQHVSNYWVMAETGSPQFMTACFATTSAAGVICALSSGLHTSFVIVNFKKIAEHKYNSDYRWSMPVIFMIQFIGVILGTIAPVARCFAALRFKLSVKWIWKQVNVCKVESYWTQKLYDWKQSNITFLSSSRNCKIVIQNLKILSLSTFIGFQKTVVVACKIITTIPIFFVICVVYCLRCWKWLKAMFSASSIMPGQNPAQLGKDKDLRRYVLQLEDDIDFAERTLKSISKSVNRLIRKAEKQQPNNLMKLLAESSGFEGVEKFDSQHVPPLLSKEYLNCWSLALVTLTTIAMSLPNIQKNLLDCLLITGVREGLVYVTFVEESLNASDDHVCIQKAAKKLWLEVDIYHKWLGNKLQNHDPQVKKAGQILQWLRDTAKNMVIEMKGTSNGVPDDNSKCKCISANSMYRITETILLSYHSNIDQLSQEELFVQLSLMIADILSACLTNLPHVILMKCHTSAIEKREASIQAAAQLLGETTQIINTLQERELPSLSSAELASIEKWRAYLMDSHSLKIISVF